MSSGSKYFRDFWNYTDIPRLVTVFLYIVLIWTNIYPQDDTFLAFVSLILWIRGVTYFRVFKSTRYLINLLIKACRDVGAFILILFYSTLSFALVFYALGTYDSTNLGDFFFYATTFYDLNIGNANTSGFDYLAWAFYVIVSIFNPLIMVNLLISILGSTYDEVKGEEVVNDSRELISLILECEFLMYWRRLTTEKCYIHVCDETIPTITAQEDSLKKKIKGVKTIVMSMIEDMNKEEVIINDIKKVLDTRNSVISELVENYEAKHVSKR
jgi:hypothetical protein